MLGLRRLGSVGRALLSSGRGLASASPAAATEEIDYKAAKVDKNLLMKLRKRTGYSFVNCKKALVHCPDDLDAAQKWLAQRAREAGWEKAAKVGGRLAAQGLVGLAASGNMAAIVELNCETDFVARNPSFQALVAASAFAAIRLAASDPSLGTAQLSRKDVSAEELMAAQVPDLGVPEVPGDQPLADFLHSTLGQLGEKLAVSRATLLSFADKDVEIVGYTHPRPSSPTPGGVQMGTFGTLVALRRGPGASDFPSATLGHQMGQQIVGLNARSVGSPASEEELARAAEEKEAREAAAQKKRHELAAAADDEGEEGLDTGPATALRLDQTELLKQDFLLHPDISVAAHLAAHGASVLDFVRFKCGETLEED